MKKILLVLTIAFLLNACSKDSSLERQLTDILIIMNEKEKRGTGYVRKLNEHERKEQQLFTDTMEMTQQRYSEVEKLVAALKKSANERMVIIEKEQQVLHDARMELDYLNEQMNGFDDEGINKIKKLLSALYNRYDTHDRFVLNYKKLIYEQTKLYTQLEDRSVRANVLDEQVNEINRLTSTIEEDIHEFNEATTEVNRLKSRALASLEKMK
ncbi:YkyA family protein [Sporosarcina sp. P13]|uniref:YkyA family protein n=1 Tax=Sporosarcina sp. P13 TaxID=2048263 RepID=UPI0013047AFB|nr:YkyA family protein [Sporosarcina sp. P13]